MKVDFAARKTSRKLARGVCCALALFCLTAPSVPALAQSWTAGNGDWSVGGNWTPSIVPNSATSDVIINNNAVVALNMNALVRDLTIGAGITLNIEPSRTLTMHGDLTNDGLIFLNPTGDVAETFFRANEDLTLGGSGSIRLGRNLAGWNSQITSATGKTITQQSDHTIEGVGQVGASLINDGVVRANASLGSGSELTLMTNNKTNTNLFEAVENSTLNISGIAVNNVGGTIRANGANSVVQLSGAMSITGGTLETMNGGLFQTSGFGVKTLSNVTNLGPLNVTSGTTLAAEGTLTNDGLIFVNPEGTVNETFFRASEDLTLGGSGSIRLGRNLAGWNSQITSATGKTITQQSDHTIEGVGQVGASLINDGVVRANASLGSGSELTLMTNNKTNTNLFEAVENSTLNISGIAVNNVGATIRANGAGSVVQLTGATSINGGTLETMNGGLFQTSDFGVKTLSDVTNLGTINVTNGTTLAAEGTLTNDGLIFVNPTGDVVNETFFRASEDLTLGGSGSIRLGRNLAGWNSQITTATGKTITQGVGHTIEGVGQIVGTLINNGTVRADETLGTGTELHLLTNAKTNNGVFSAVNGGVFRSDSGLLTNWNAGTQTLTGGTYEVIGDSTMRLVGVNVQTLDAHVRLDGANSNFFSTAAGSTNALANFDTIGSAGQLSLLNSRQLTSSAGLMSQGIIDLDGALTRLTVTGDFNQTAGLTQLANGATLELLGASNMFGGGMLAGNGTIDGSFTLGNGAVMSPGFSPGQIDVVGDFTWEAGGLIDFDLGLSSDFVDINGDFLKSGAGAWAFNFINNGMSVGTTYDLIGFSGTTTFVASDFSFTNPGAFNGDFAFGNGGQTLQFTLTAIPEPGTGGVLMLTALGLALFRRRRSTK